MNNQFNETNEIEFTLYDEVMEEKNKRNHRREVEQRKKELQEERELMEYEW